MKDLGIEVKEERMLPLWLSVPRRTNLSAIFPERFSYFDDLDVAPD